MLSFAETSMKIQKMLSPYHNMPCINTIMILDWINRGLDPERQIIPVIQETIIRKLRAKAQVPTSLKYYDAILKTIRPLPKAVEDTDTQQEKDLKLARIYRHQMTMSILKETAEIKLKRLQDIYGNGFGL